MRAQSLERKAVRARPAPGRPRRFTHDQIVEAALDVMEREGFASLTLSSLASCMKVSHSVLYKYVGDIKALEGEALQRLAASIPLPKPGTPRQIREQAIECLLMTREVLLKHPAVLYPPIGSKAWDTFRERVVEWVLALTPFAENAAAAAIGHSALVSSVALSAEVQRHHGSAGLARVRETRLPPPVQLRTALEHLLDNLFPGLKKAR